MKQTGVLRPASVLLQVSFSILIPWAFTFISRGNQPDYSQHFFRKIFVTYVFHSSPFVLNKFKLIFFLKKFILLAYFDCWFYHMLFIKQRKESSEICWWWVFNSPNNWDTLNLVFIFCHVYYLLFSMQIMVLHIFKSQLCYLLFDQDTGIRIKHLWVWILPAVSY